MKINRASSVKLLIGTAIALLTIWLTFRKTDWNELSAVFQTAGWGYALAVLPALALSYLFRIYRWSPFLPGGQGKEDLRNPPDNRFMLNSVLPGRLGEFARSALLTRKTGIPFASSFATVVVARLFDGLTLTGLAIVVMAAMWESLSVPCGAAHSRRVGYAVILLVLIALGNGHGRTVA